MTRSSTTAIDEQDAIDTRLLRSVLDAAALRYALRHTDAGVPYAGFRVDVGAGEPVAFTARVRGGVMQIVAHRALERPPYTTDLWRINTVNQQWELGSFFYDRRRESYAASMSWPVSHMLEDEAVVLAMVSALRGAVQHLRRSCCFADVIPAGGTIEFVAPADADITPSFDEFLEMQWLAVPAMAATVRTSVVRNVSVAADALGLERDGDAFAQVFKEPDGDPFRVEVRCVDERVLLVRATHPARKIVRCTDETIRVVHDLNDRLPIGVVCLNARRRVGDVDARAARAYHTLAVPLAWTTIDVAVVRLLIDHAAAAISAIDGEFHRGAARVEARGEERCS